MTFLGLMEHKDTETQSFSVRCLNASGVYIFYGECSELGEFWDTVGFIGIKKEKVRKKWPNSQNIYM